MSYKTKFKIGDIVDTGKYVFRVTEIIITRIGVWYTGKNTDINHNEDDLILAKIKENE